MAQKIITANRLRDGDVVYLTATGSWSLWLEESLVVDDDAGEARLLDAAAKAEEERLVVGSYVMKVDVVDGEIRPLSQRELLRSLGPSNRLDHGKQAERSL